MSAAVRDIAIDELKKLGATIELVPNTPEKSNHVLATLKGTGKAKILLMAHMDTVFKEGSAAERPFHIKDGRAYGPGVMDDKGGIVAGALLVFIPCVGEFVIPELLGGPQTLMIGRVLWDEFFANNDWPMAASVAVVMVLLIIVPLALFNRYQAEQAAGGHR